MLLTARQLRQVIREAVASPPDDSYKRWQEEKRKTISSHAPEGHVSPTEMDDASLDRIAALATRARGNTLLADFLEQNPNARIPVIRYYSLDTPATILAIEVHGLQVPSPEGFRNYALVPSRYDTSVDYILLEFTPGVNGYGGAGVVKLRGGPEPEEEIESKEEVEITNV
tara:strand:- start:828 stop:1337 length:510 start_codon:yes stop_codon:yes gene_type:complete